MGLSPCRPFGLTGLACHYFMSASLIICCAGRPAINGYKRRSFTWVAEYGCYVHDGKVLSESEFNAVSQEVMAKNQDLRCFAKVVNAAADADPRIAGFEKALAEKQARIEALQSSVLTLRAHTTPSLEQALEVVETLAPERLKKKPGRKAELQEV